MKIQKGLLPGFQRWSKAFNLEKDLRYEKKNGTEIGKTADMGFLESSKLDHDQKYPILRDSVEDYKRPSISVTCTCISANFAQDREGSCVDLDSHSDIYEILNISV